MRRILGIDPGSRITGFGIIEVQPGAQPMCLVGGTLRPKPMDLPLRLRELFLDMQSLVAEYQPTELAIEQVFVHKNVRSALSLGQARGVLLASVMQQEIPVYEYAPRQIKAAVVGFGGADKAQVQHMCQMLLKLREKPQADAADALAVALCHLHSHHSTVVAKRKSWRSYDSSSSR